jgi:hypothetical protein
MYNNYEKFACKINTHIGSSLWVRNLVSYVTKGQGLGVFGKRIKAQ